MFSALRNPPAEERQMRLFYLLKLVYMLHAGTVRLKMQVVKSESNVEKRDDAKMKTGNKGVLIFYFQYVFIGWFISKRYLSHEAGGLLRF